MVNKKTTKLNYFKIKAKVWVYKGPSAWHFVTIPKKESGIIKKYFSEVKRGWGSLPVKVKIGLVEWKTSIFPDKKLEAYLLPLKIEMRKKINIASGDIINFTLTVTF